MNSMSLDTALTHPIAMIVLAAFMVFIAGIVMMRMAKGRDQWVDTASVMQGAGGSVFIGLLLTFFMA